MTMSYVTMSMVIDGQWLIPLTKSFSFHWKPSVQSELHPQYQRNHCSQNGNEKVFRDAHDILVGLLEAASCERDKQQLAHSLSKCLSDTSAALLSKTRQWNELMPKAHINQWAWSEPMSKPKCKTCRLNRSLFDLPKMRTAAQDLQEVVYFLLFTVCSGNLLVCLSGSMSFDSCTTLLPTHRFLQSTE